METKQLNGYRVEFYSGEEYYEGYQSSTHDNLWVIPALNEIDYVRKLNGIIQYAGLATEISEELAERIVDKITEDDWDEIELSLPIEERFSGYRDYQDRAYSCETAKDSFKTLSNLPYCVIIKNK